MRKIAVLACLSSLDPSYSVAGVVHDQLMMLQKYHEDIVFITTDDFQDKYLDLILGIEVRYYPRYTGETEPESLDLVEFEKYAFETSSILRNHLSDCTHVIQHDLLFINSFIPINWAIRQCAELLPDLKWLHWQHSAPSPKPNDCEYPFDGCYMGMPNSKFIYLNRTDIPGVAERYNIPENQVFVVHNFIDFERLFNLHPLTVELIDYYNLLDCDTLCIYPTRLVEPKQIDKVIALIAGIKNKQKARLVICNSYSNADKEKEYLLKLKECGLTSEELIFTSEFDSNWCKDNLIDIQLGIPREVTLDLMRLADLFILPSISECCSMIMLEAAANKNLIVLNDDVMSMHEFGGQKLNDIESKRALYMQFGSIARPIGSYLPSEEEWFRDHANKILDAQNHNQAIGFFKFVRKRHNPKWIYFNELKPLLDL